MIIIHGSGFDMVVEDIREIVLRFFTVDGLFLEWRSKTTEFTTFTDSPRIDFTIGT
jgi:hypothetical protein